MRLLCPLLALLTSAPAPAAEKPTLQDARQRWLKGQYSGARTLYQALAKEAKIKAPATVGLSRAWQSEGEYDKALAVVEDALKGLPKDAHLLARRAELMYLRGKWDEAEKAANRAVDLEKKQFLARWVRGQIYRDRGDLKKANAEFKWFVVTYNNTDVKNSEDLVLVALGATEYARYNHLSDQFEFVLKEIYGDEVFKKDKNFW